MLKITDTTLRDAHQSLWATRMSTADMLPILSELDEVGYYSLEVWGGATFDVCMRFLDEDPWERLRVIKRNISKTPLQMLLRGQSMLGYQHYPDDVVKAFVYKAVENGIDIIRIFDALNDIRNMETALDASKKAGAHVQATVVYTISPVHTTEHFLRTAQDLQDMGADSICIKDMAGMLTPFKAKELVERFKSKLKVPIQLHSHYIGGMALGSYLLAAEAGVDIVDTASVPLAFGASQPPVETVVRALQESDLDTGLDIKKLFRISAYFEELRKRYGYDRGVTRISDMQVFEHQVPGGMISNLVSQLKQQKGLDKINDVLEEIPRVRRELGYPPLVTPTSQIVGTQAVLNVMSRERYKLVPSEVKAYVKGYYGKAPGEIDPVVQKRIIGDEKPITCRPADLLPPVLESSRSEIGTLALNEEDVLSYALFPQVARRFFESRNSQEKKVCETTPKSQTESKKDSPMKLHEVKELIQLIDSTDINELKLESNGVKLSLKKSPEVSGAVSNSASYSASLLSDAPVPPAQHFEPEVIKSNANHAQITSPMVGTFYYAGSPDAQPYVEKGSVVKNGQIVCIIEAMKLMNEIESEISGKIVDILVKNSQPVEYGQPLFLVEKH